MQLANQLIEIVTEPHECRRERVRLDDDCGRSIEKHGSTKMYGAHAERLCTALDVEELTLGQTQIELMAARSGLVIFFHFFLGRAHASWGLGTTQVWSPKIVFAA